MVMKLLIRGRIFPKGGGDDAEHPSLIPMDVPTSPSTPLGPMTRARAKAIEDKVNSLLSELSLHTHETWLLPHSETLCVIRCLEASHGIATYKSQDGEDPKHDGQEEEMPRKLQALDDRHCPDVRRVPGPGRPDPSGRPTLRHPNQIYGRPERTGRPDDKLPSRMYGRPTTSGHPDRHEAPDDRPPPDDRRDHDRVDSTDARARPDVRTVPSLRTSDAFRTTDT